MPLTPDTWHLKGFEIGMPIQMSDDAKEGTKAFKEKRKPVFKGR